MIFFWLMLLLVLSAVAALTWWALGAIVPETHLAAYRRVLLLFDVSSFLALSLGSMFWQLPAWLSRLCLILLSAIWMMQLIFGVLTAIARGLQRVSQKNGSAPLDGERRRFLRWAAGAPLLAGLAGVYGVTEGRSHTVVREISVPFIDIGEELHGFRIAQISDVHLGLFFSLEDLNLLLEAAVRTRADALVITGDVFDDDKLNVEAVGCIDAFVGHFPKGIWFCYGNHEYFRNIKRTNLALGASRIRVLQNNSACVIDGSRPLYFAGVDYPFPRKDFSHLAAAYTSAAMAGVPENAVTVFLAHHPDFIAAAAAHGAALALAGHTHGGQIGAFGVPLVPPIFKYMRGAYQVGDTLGYVHCGNGSWFPYRFGCPPEIAVFQLEKKA